MLLDSADHRSKHAELSEWLKFIQAETHVLQIHPELIWQQAANQPKRSAVSRCAEVFRASGRWPRRPWLRWINVPDRRSPCLMTLTGQPSINCLAVTPDGRKIVSGGMDDIRIWDANSGRELLILSDHTKEVTSILVTPDSKRIVSASHDETIGVWDVESGQRTLTLRGHTGAVRALAVLNGQLLSGGADKTLRAWDIEIGKLLSTQHLFEEVCRLQTAASGDLVVLSLSNLVKVLDSKSGAELTSLPLPSTATITPDGRRIVSFRSIEGRYGQIEIWDVRDGQMIHTMSAHPAERGFYPGVKAIAVSPDGQYIFSGGADRVINVWDAETFGLISTLEGHNTEVWALAVYPDSHRLASGGWDQMLKIWQIEAP